MQHEQSLLQPENEHVALPSECWTWCRGSDKPVTSAFSVPIRAARLKIDYGV